MKTRREKCPTCNTDAICRDWGAGDYSYEAVIENSEEARIKLFNIQRAIDKYYLSLDERKHGGVAADTAFFEIQEAMGMSWERGEVLERVIKHPKFREMIER